MKNGAGEFILVDHYPNGDAIPVRSRPVSDSSVSGSKKREGDSYFWDASNRKLLPNIVFGSSKKESARYEIIKVSKTDTVRWRQEVMSILLAACDSSPDKMLTTVSGPVSEVLAKRPSSKKRGKSNDSHG